MPYYLPWQESWGSDLNMYDSLLQLHVTAGSAEESDNQSSILLTHLAIFYQYTSGHSGML